jgi:type VI secretion system protein ImpB
MSDKGSVAPKERVNIVYKSHTGDQTEDVELPLKMLVLGDFTGRASDEIVEERPTININKENFDDVLKNYGLNLNLSVPNKLDENASEDDKMPVELKMSTMKDFSPDNIAEQVPELKSLLELRKSLLALKGPLGNVPAFRKAIQGILSDDEAREKLLNELGVSDDESQK